MSCTQGMTFFRRSHAGAADIRWLPEIGQMGLGVITRDKMIRRRPEELSMIEKHKVRAFFLTQSGQASNWQILCLLVKHWEKMEAKMSKPGPFAYAVHKNGVEPLKL